MASTDARPVPIKNTAFRLYFSLRLNTGALNAGAAGLDSEISKDGATQVDCTNEATEIATSTGRYYLDLTSSEMNADCVSLTVKSSTTNAVPFTIDLYPQEAGDIKVDIESIVTSTIAALRQKELAESVKTAAVDTATFTATTTDFETNITASESTDFRKGATVIFTSGSLAQQRARILASTYTVNNKVKLTVTALTAAPANGVTFDIA
jgi:hypothetical protein